MTDHVDANRCEHCGSFPVGTYNLHDYCIYCSENLCDGCMNEEKCTDSKSLDHHHHPSLEDHS